MKLTVTDEQKIQSCIEKAPSLQDALRLVYEDGSKCGLKTDEKTLFRTVLCYFKNKPYCTVFETHQDYVVNTKDPKQKRCEISDLLTITYSRRLNGTKINFLQAKLVPFNQSNLGLVHANNTDYFKFHLDSTQYRLLKDRPLIINTGLPSTILADACTESITSYGVFYKVDESINMAYEITSLLQPSDPATVTINGGRKLCYFNTTKTSHGLRRLNKFCCAPSNPYDLLSTLSADTFEQALLHFQIGSPVCRTMAMYLSEMIHNMLEPQTDTTNDFCNFIDQMGYLRGTIIENLEAIGKEEYMKIT